MNIERQPWFYGCLSYVLPGFGQIWMGKFVRGAFFSILFIGTYTLSYYFIGTWNFAASVPAIISAIGICFLPLIAALDAVRQARLRLIASGETPVKRCCDKWFPVFLSFLVLLSGLSYLYLRKWIFFAIWLFLLILIEIIPLEPLVANILFFILYISVIIHVFILVKNRNGNIVNSQARIFFILLVSLICVYYLVILLFNKIYHSPEVIIINSSSMEPTLRLNNWIVIDYRAYRQREPQVGDIAVMNVKKIPQYVEYLHDSGKPIGRIICKRIVAKEGDTVTIVDQRYVYVNGKKVGYNVPPEHIQEKDITPSDRTFNIPSGQYFLMGDNFYRSMDSRSFGLVSREAIKGRVIKVLWPISKARVL